MRILGLLGEIVQTATTWLSGSNRKRKQRQDSFLSEKELHPKRSKRRDYIPRRSHMRSRQEHTLSYTSDSERASEISEDSDSQSANSWPRLRKYNRNLPRHKAGSGSHNRQGRMIDLQGRLVPILNSQGHIISYIQQESSLSVAHHTLAKDSSAPISHHGTASKAHRVVTPGKLEAFSNESPDDPSKWHEPDLTDPAPLTAFVPLNVQPVASARRGLDVGVPFTSISLLEGRKWTPWPSGHFALDLEHREYLDSDRLGVHWVTKGNGGDSKGSVNSLNITGGLITNKQCLGIIHCTNSSCKVILRPLISKASRQQQLLQACKECGASLVHQECPSRSVLIKWGRIGDNEMTAKFRYINGTPHTHPRIPHVKHFTGSEKTEFKQLVISHPELGPTGLTAGPPIVGGYGRGAAAIGPAGKNRDFVAYTARKVKSDKLAQSGSWFVDQFAHWQEKNPGVVRTNIFRGDIIIISVQTSWMSKMLLPETPVIDPVNGLVTDAAHGYWKEGRHLLIITSVFSATLGVWVPGLFTFSNGASSEHYHYHFMGVFQSIASVAHQKGIKVTDEMFIMVVDFSDAQISGFKMAFIDFMSTAEFDGRNLDELNAAVNKLLRGCEYHFQSGVASVVRLGGVIQKMEQAIFRKMVLSLINIESDEVFQDTVDDILLRWPQIKPWLSWWLQPKHAQMLFASQRTMSPELAAQIPRTTNAEESMHHTIYQIAGSKRLDLIPGLNGLLHVERWFHSRYDHASVGGKDSYGLSGLQFRQQQYAKYGRTKATRNPDRKKLRTHRKGHPPTQGLFEFGHENLYKKAARQGARQQVFKASRNPGRKKRNLQEGKPPTRGQYALFPKRTSSRKSNRKASADSEEDTEVWNGIDLNDQESEGESDKKENEKANHYPHSKPYSDIFPTPAHNFNAEFEIVQSRKHPYLPGIPWSNNSCWLDTTLEALFATLCLTKTHWLDICKLAEMENASSAQANLLYVYLQNRRGWPLSSFPHSPEQQIINLAQQRDDLRKNLIASKLVNFDSVGHHRDAVSWLHAAISKDTETSLHHYFSGLYYDLDLCSLSEQKGITVFDHFLISRPRNQSVLFTSLGPDTHKKHEGNISSWFKSITNIKVAISYQQAEPESCWRRIDNENPADTLHMCSGACIRTRFFTRLPSVLILEPDTLMTPDWSFPRFLNTRQDKNLQYELIARIFYGHSHFICRFSVPSGANGRQAVYTYDGMKNNGYSEHISGAIETLLAGTEPENVPAGFRTYAVIYRLRGGQAAQETFHQMQLKQLETALGVNLNIPSSPSLLSTSNYYQLNAEERGAWVNPNSLRWSRSSEFEQKKGQVSHSRAFNALRTSSSSESNGDTSWSQFHQELSDGMASDNSSGNHKRGVSRHSKSYILAELDNTNDKASKTSPTVHLSPPTSSPEPAEPLPIACRCGEIGNGHRAILKQEVVPCNNCGYYSHVACLTFRRTAGVPKPFICDRCLLPSQQAERVKVLTPFKQTRSRKFESIEKLGRRLYAGVMALGRYGPTFYYPCRLIAKHTQRHKQTTWTVKWWRYSNHLAAGQVEEISSERIVDAFFGNVAERRKIRLGEWLRAHAAAEKEDEEEELIQPEILAYTTEFRKALQPHISILDKLLNQPQEVPADTVPAKRWIEQEKTSPGKEVPFTGLLSYNDQLRINNWFWSHIPQAKDTLHNWIATVPIAHARTLFVAYRHREEIKESWNLAGDQSNPEDIEQYIVEEAWKRLQKFTGMTSDGQPQGQNVDVDLEALKLLEQQMFDRSEAAGTAGHYQWGLDKGMHQNDWNPYDQFAPENAIGYPQREPSEEPLPAGPNYDYEEERQWNKAEAQRREDLHTKRPRPKPRPIMSPKKED